MIITRTLKKINQFRPDTFVISPEHTKVRSKSGVSVSDDGSYTLDAGIYELVFNETWHGIMPPALQHFAENGISFGHFVHETDDGTAVLMTIGNGFLKIWPGVSIVEYFMAPAGDTVEKRGRGRPPRAATPEIEVVEKTLIESSEDINGSE